MESEFYLHKLQSLFELRKGKNKSYSLRAYARDLGIHPASLSAVLRKKRKLPLALCLQFCEKMKLTGAERKAFIESAQHSLAWGMASHLDSVNRKQTIQDDAIHFKMIAEWEYYALLTFLDTSRFDGQLESIAQSFGWTLTKTTSLVHHLMQLQLLKLHGGKLVRSNSNELKTSEDIVSQALQLAHLQELDLAKDRLPSVPVDLRDYSSNCMAINRTKIPQAKQLIREFRRNMEKLLETGSRNDVYLLGIQLFPLSQVAYRSPSKSSRRKKRSL